MSEVAPPGRLRWRGWSPLAKGLLGLACAGLALASFLILTDRADAPLVAAASYLAVVAARRTRTVTYVRAPATSEERSDLKRMEKLERTGQWALLFAVLTPVLLIPVTGPRILVFLVFAVATAVWLALILALRSRARALFAVLADQAAAPAPASPGS